MIQKQGELLRKRGLNYRFNFNEVLTNEGGAVCRNCTRFTNDGGEGEMQRKEKWTLGTLSLIIKIKRERLITIYGK